MDYRPSASWFVGSTVLPVLAFALAIGIFIIDTLTPLGIAVAVLYIVVLFLAATFLERRGLLLVAIGCVALTVLSYILTHGDSYGPALARGVFSLAAIGMTTFLILKNQAANIVLQEQAGLLDVTHDAIFVRDMKDHVTYWNRGARKLYGWNPEEAVGGTAHQLLRTEFPDALEVIMAELIRNDRWEGELVHKTRDGVKVTVASRWSLQRDSDGQPIAILETNNDITEQRRFEEKTRQQEKELQETRAELAHVNRVTTLGELAASIAHEVNQPIAAVVTNAGAGLRWLAATPPNMDEVRNALGRIVKDGERAGEVLGRIRSLVKKAPMRLEQVDINDTILEVVALTRSEVQRNGVLLRADLSPHLPKLPGDRVQLQQVILNLIMNAIEAMSAASSDPRRELSITSTGDGESGVLISVKDSGPGIDTQSLDRLFHPFYTTKADGLGMGLAISHSLIQAHGGRLWATSEMGKGSTFHFNLPSQRDGEV